MLCFHRIPVFIWFVALVVGVLCACGVLSRSAMAQLTPLPEVGVMTAEDFVRDTDVVTKTFEEDQYLKFEFQIHKHWKEEEFINLKNLARRGRLYGPIVQYNGPPLGDVRPYFRVVSEEIEREISAKNWLVTYALDNGYTLRSLEEIGPEKIEALYASYEGRDVFVIRTVGQRMGPRMVIAEYAVPMKNWPEFTDYQTLTIKSFKINSIDKDPIEEKRYFAYLQAIELSYPKSWRIENEKTDVENKLHFDLVNTVDGQAVVGQISVDVISTRSVKDMDNINIFEFNPSEEIKSIRDRYTEKFKFKKLLEKKTYTLPATVSFQMTEVHALEQIKSIYDTYEEGEDTFELWFTIVSHGNRYIILSLLTPARSQDLYNWSVNTETFRKVVESMQLQ